MGDRQMLMYRFSEGIQYRLSLPLQLLNKYRTAITKVHSEPLRFMLFHSVENWSGPREFPEYNIGDYPKYNNPDFELLMYDDRSPYNTINIIKLTPIWSKRLSKTGWIRKVFRNEWNHRK